MKYYINLIFLFSCLIGSAQNDSIVIKGKLKGQGNQRISMSVTGDDGKLTNYATTAVNDMFTIKVKKQEMLQIGRMSSAAIKTISKTVNEHNYGNPTPPLDIFIYQSDLTINGETDYLHLASVKGDIENDSYSKLKKETEIIDKREWDLRIAVFMLDENDSAERKKNLSEAMELSRKKTEIHKKYINNNRDAFASIFLLSRMENMYTAGDYETAFNNLSDDYKQTQLAQKIAKRIEYLSPTGVGKQAISFVKKDKDGNEIDLSKYKGKIVLLDFWGSWCGPCRASHPHLKELYKEYKDKGFEIIAIASEVAKTPGEQRLKWLEAIEKDGIPWIHILNNEEMKKQDIVSDYRVNAFPTKILVDKDGKILLRITASATDDIDRMLEKKLGK